MDREDENSVGEILTQEKLLYRAMIDRDFKYLQKVLSEDLAYVHSTGVLESKAQYLAGIAHGLYEYEYIESKDVAVRIYGEIGVQTGCVEMSVGASGEPKNLIRLLFTLVWVNQAGRWRLCLRQATRIPAE